MLKDDLKICVVSEFPPPVGGIGQQAQLLYSFLKKEQMNVCRIKTNGYLNSRLKVFGDIRYLKSLMALLYYIRQLFYIIPRVDITHILSGSYLNFFLFTFPAVIISKIFRKKVIIHYHGGGAEVFLQYWHFFAGPVLRLSDFIVFPSDFLSDVFKKFGFEGIVIPNILSLNDFCFKERRKLSPLFIVTRHLRPEYNVACVIKAFALIKSNHPEASLLIIGDGSEKNNLIKLTHKLKCEKAVTFLGRISNDKMPALYEQSDFFLNASMVDNMPVSIMEAFACGCIVVTTNAGGIPYMVAHQENGFVVQLDDHTSMAKEVLWVLDHQEEGLQVAINAKKEIKKFSWESIRKSIFYIYQS